MAAARQITAARITVDFLAAWSCVFIMKRSQLRRVMDRPGLR